MSKIHSRSTLQKYQAISYLHFLFSKNLTALQISLNLKTSATSSSTLDDSLPSSNTDKLVHLHWYWSCETREQLQSILCIGLEASREIFGKWQNRAFRTEKPPRTGLRTRLRGHEDGGIGRRWRSAGWSCSTCGSLWRSEKEHFSFDFEKEGYRYVGNNCHCEADGEQRIVRNVGVVSCRVVEECVSEVLMVVQGSRTYRYHWLIPLFTHRQHGKTQIFKHVLITE